MKTKEKKITKMCDELLKYYFNKKATNISININEENEKYTIISKAKFNMTEDEIENLIENLPEHRDLEYETYWELIGEYSDDNELELLFLLSNSIHIYYENNFLIFNLEV